MVQTPKVTDPSAGDDLAHEYAWEEDVKIASFVQGLTISAAAEDELRRLNGGPLIVREYPTTSGVTLRFPSGMSVNALPAPVGSGIEPDSEAVQFDHQPDLGFLVNYRYRSVPVSLVPLPGYLGHRAIDGSLLTDAVYSHGDRVRIAPVAGCAYRCGFCDLPANDYSLRSLGLLRAALRTALADDRLPTRHAMISGGSPRRRDEDEFEALCCDLIWGSPVPMDVMLTARPNDPEFPARLVEAGATGISLNLELWSETMGGSRTSILRGKASLAQWFEPTLEETLRRTGRANGRVRSLVLIGLEPIDNTLAAVEFLATRGCDPVLSPFQPAPNTRLAGHRAPTVAELRTVLDDARVIAAENGVELGPRCVGCQHNALSFPWDVTSDPYVVANCGANR